VREGCEEFRSSGVQEFRSSGVQEFRSSRSAGVQGVQLFLRPAPELLQLLNSFSY
jgi:hypothetical protein